MPPYSRDFTPASHVIMHSLLYYRCIIKYLPSPPNSGSCMGLSFSSCYYGKGGIPIRYIGWPTGGGGQLRTLAADTGEVLFVCSGVHPIATLRILANAQPDRNQDEKSLWQYGCCYGTYLIW